MRCPDCNKFVSYDTDTEPEIESEEFDEEAVSFTVRIVNTCAECGTELTEASFELEDEIPEEVLSAHEGEDHSMSLSDVSAERTERTQTHDRHGKPIKNSRYMKHFYGVEVSYSLNCSCDGAPPQTVHTGVVGDDIPASNMDELV